MTQYLNTEAVDATLSWVLAHAAPGSAIIFDYQTLAGRFLAQAQRRVVGAMLSLISGEHREFGIEQSQKCMMTYWQKKSISHPARTW